MLPWKDFMVGMRDQSLAPYENRQSIGMSILDKKLRIWTHSCIDKQDGQCFRKNSKLNV